MVALREGNSGRADATGEGGSEEEGQAQHRRSRSWRTASRSDFAAWNEGTVEAAISMDSPVRGLRPCRASRCFTERVPKPEMLTDSPLARASEMVSSTALTATSASAFESKTSAAMRPAMSDCFIFAFSLRRYPTGRTVEARSRPRTSCWWRKHNYGTLSRGRAATTVISTRVPGARSACTQARCGQFAASPIHSHHSASICALFAMSVR